MGSAFNKEIVRSITGTIGRFAAIAIISLLGAGFYAGLRMAAPDMRIDADEFFDATNMYDISVMTELGVDDGTLGILREIDGIGEVMPARKADALVRIGESSYAACIESLPMDAARKTDTSDGVHATYGEEGYLNRPILESGAWPTAANECVVGVDAARELGISEGSTIAVERSTQDIDDVFSTTTLTVTGLVNSPTYILSSTLGPTLLGSGSLDLYVYVPDSTFANDMPYSVAYLTVPAARGAVWDSAAYDEAVSEVVKRIEDQEGRIADERWQNVKDDLHQQVVGAFQELAVSLDWADEIEKPDVFVLDRSKNVGAASLSSDAEGITKIATFLPFMFFLVAALVSLTSMTRMVEEERMVIGTHKALGYGKGRIGSKYVIYGLLASGIGSVVGVVLLGTVLPWFIVTSYGVSYAVPVYGTPIDPGVSAWAIGLSVGITTLATWWVVSTTLRERPAMLMLPRVPKAGKRIILERIRPLWQRMSFSHKVTARNILRYKRRFFMAVAGVAGCTALLMVGFGLRDAIGGIVSSQYEDLVTYDATVRIDADTPDGDSLAEAAAVLRSPDVESSLVVGDESFIANGLEEDVRIEVVVPSEVDRLGEFVSLRDRETQQPFSFGSGGVILTEKAASMIGVKAGDSVVLYEEDTAGDKTGEGHSLTVAGIAENYLGHYAYVDPQAYRAAFEDDIDFDLHYVKLAEGTSHDSFSDKLLSIDAVNSVSFVADKIVTYEDMLDVMNKLIYVIMALSAALAFVVLYNLTNINIAERVREIATLKVLGFTRGETNAYIFREVIVMALIGALIGCVAGVPLTFYIAEAAETSQMMFGRVIEPASFVLAFVLTLAFAAIVLFTMRPKLAHVNMVESLKSVE